MHARLDQLLKLRDEPVADVAVSAHLRGCAECTRSLAGLQRVRDQLAALPAAIPPCDGWQRVQAGLRRRERASQARARASMLAATASLAVLAILATLWLGESDRASNQRAVAAPAVAGRATAGTAAEAVDSVAHLRAQSQALEQLLAELPSRPAVERAATSLPIASLEAQVQWLDHRLSTTPVEDPAGAEAGQLWRQRVEVMNSLVRLRYVEAQRVAL